MSVMLAMLVFSEMSAQSSPQRAGGAGPHAQGEIKGRVVDVVGGLPISGAAVLVRTPAGVILGEPELTDASGAFRVGGLPSGQYVVMASKDGFLSTAFGQTDAGEPPRPVRVVAGTPQPAISIALYRGAIVTGVVTDHHGAPIAGAQVIAYRRLSHNGQVRLAATGNASITDDRGEYRIHGLPRHRYYLLASPRGRSANHSATNRWPYPTYYPNATSLEGAQRVDVKGGDTATASITVEFGKAFSIRGTVPNSSIETHHSTMLSIRPLDGATAVASRAVSISPSGAFHIRGVVPGRYLLQTQLASPSAVHRVMAGVVEVRDSDVDSMVLSAVDMLSISGRIVVEGEAGESALRPSSLRISASPATLSRPLGPQVGGVVGDDFTFSFKTWPGLALVRVVIDQPGWAVKRVSLDGRDISDFGHEFVADSSELVVELTNRISQLAGSVSASDIAGAGFVVVFARDENVWVARSGRHVAVVRPDDTGRFDVKSLPAGDYYAVAVSRFDPADAQDPEVLKRLIKHSKRLTLSAGAKTAVDLTMLNER